MKVFLELHTQFGQYKCETLDVTEEEYEKLKDYTVTYFNEPFQAYLDDGTFMVVPVSVLHYSQLFIKLAEA
jgi:hypothetical protein